MKWAWNDGRDTAPVARSSLPCPSIIRDGLDSPVQHQADGRWYDSKRGMAKATRDAGCIEIGNEMPVASQSLPLITKGEVAEAYQMVKQGYKPDVPVEAGIPEESGWTDG